MWGRPPQVDEREDALLQLLGGCQDELYRFALVHTQNPETAMDALQDATVKSLEKLYTLRDVQYLRTWFYRILLNECTNQFRRQQRLVNLEEQPESSSPDPALAERLTLYQCVEKLPPELRTVIVLRFFHDMKLGEVAQVTGTNENTVKTRLYRAIRLLKAEMED